jgi:hypothetical protein
MTQPVIKRKNKPNAKKDTTCTNCNYRINMENITETDFGDLACFCLKCGKSFVIEYPENYNYEKKKGKKATYTHDLPKRRNKREKERRKEIRLKRRTKKRIKKISAVLLLLTILLFAIQYIMKNPEIIPKMEKEEEKFIGSWEGEINLYNSASLAVGMTFLSDKTVSVSSPIVGHGSGTWSIMDEKLIIDAVTETRITFDYRFFNNESSLELKNTNADEVWNLHKN